MNSSEVKKVIWGVNLAVIGGLAFVGYFVNQNMNTPNLVIPQYKYKEPLIKNANRGYAGNNRNSINGVFNWTPPRKTAPRTKAKPATSAKTTVKTPVVRGIDKVLELHHILGHLAFIYIKKDKKIKTFLINSEIKDANDVSIGILKEVHSHYVLILVKNKLEKLFIDGYVSPEDELTSTDGTTDSKSSVASKKGPVLNNTKTKVTKRPNTHTTTYNKNNFRNKTRFTNNNQIVKKKPTQNNDQPEVVIKHKSSFNGNAFEFTITKDSDGTTHRKIPLEMARSLQSRKNKEIFLNTNNYNLTYLNNGILVKSIKNEEVKKFFSAFGIQQDDIITKVNGQTLGNKSEDDILELYQQIEGSAKYVTIELLKKGKKLQKFRVSIDAIKQRTKK
ncbi:MAG: hypothetical protein COA79_02975 [Planctomycetota bacterium]|nr:MAG: hypothetical protein COA79_02975 [Planctomycetota bacterium]